VIAIVDDDEAVRLATTKLVRLHGFDAHSFASAEEFLESSVVAEASCLVTDVRMPGMSGVDLQDRLIALGRRIPVIFITAFPEERRQRKALGAGATCFLTKPFAGQTLMQYIDMALARRAAAPSD
jgi:FixJ family two-component response regulator